MYRVLYLLLFYIGLLFFPFQATGQQVALKTNVLFWAATTPNAGVEFAVGRRFTIDLWGAYNAWKFPNDMKLNLYLVQPEVRFWPCRKFEGHFLGENIPNTNVRNVLNLSVLIPATISGRHVSAFLSSISYANIF